MDLIRTIPFGFVGFYVVVCYALMAISRLIDKYRYTSIFSFSRKYNYFADFDENGTASSLFSFVYIIIHTVVISLLICAFVFSNKLSYLKIPNWFVLFVVHLFVSLFICIKWFIGLIYFGTFGKENLYLKLLQSKFYYFAIHFLVSMPLLIFYYYYHLLQGTILVLLVLTTLFFYFRIYQKFISLNLNEILINKYLVFLYLCALEIAPLAMLVVGVFKVVK